MSQFSSMTVAQLKEALKEKELPTDGKKADLIARLAEAHTTGDELNDALAPAQQPQATEEPQEELLETENDPVAENTTTTAPTDAVLAGANGSDSTETEQKPEKKVLTPEERKALAVDLLTKKIKRAEKFGDEALAAVSRKDLARVQKFGVDPSTALGKEIGGLSNEVNSELGARNRGFNKGRGNRNKNKVVKK